MPTAKPAGDRLRAPSARDAKGVAASLRARALAPRGRARGRARTLVSLLPAETERWEKVLGV